jgi:deoxyadenosine/deoxycytidine kinase
MDTAMPSQARDADRAAVTFPSPYIVITGPVGSGKSTLTARLARAIGWTPLFESPGDNPFITDFYAGRTGYAFLTQAWFQAETLGHMHRIASVSGKYLLERSLGERHEVFVLPLHEAGVISPRECAALETLNVSGAHVVHEPDLMITVRCPIGVLVDRIRERGRSYEEALDGDWFARHLEYYENYWSKSSAPQLAIDSERLPFSDRATMTDIADMVRSSLRSLNRWSVHEGKL